ncbi:HesA/MoeB/ThiF family protein, partial [archaeon]|nr:HesA/MoeB/ThiF family protein [archaeon]
MKDNRYSRQLLIPEWSQDALKKTCVLVLGVGATGSIVATNLVMSGVGKIILVDYDTVEVSNLNRQLLFREEDVGKNKAYVAKFRLESFNPDVDIIDFGEKMQNISDELKNSVDIIASCLDTFEGRRWANSLALNIRKPMVNGGMFAFMGDVQTILPYDSACFECQPLVSQEKLAQACSPLGEERKEEKNNIEKIALPSISTLSSIIGGLMSQEIIKLILGVGSLVKNYLFYDGLSNSFTELELKRTKECPLCGE